jgi:uncharacterized repeat protein (TIGR01451 family)
MREDFVPPGLVRVRRSQGPWRHLLLLFSVMLGFGLLAPGRMLAQTSGPTPTPAPPGVATPAPVPPGAPQLSVNKSVQPTSGPVGTRVTFTIVVSNVGAGDAHDVVVTDVMPDTVQVLSATTSQGTAKINGQQVEVTIGILAPGEIVTITIAGVIRVGTPAGTPIHNMVQATASDAPTASATADLLPVEAVLPQSGGGSGSPVLGLLLIVALIGGGWALRPRRSVAR